jgi:hypothetical protein
MHPTVFVDITGASNAKYPLCATGRETSGNPIKFMSVPDFTRTLDRLLELGLATPDSTVIRLSVPNIREMGYPRRFEQNPLPVAARPAFWPSLKHVFQSLQP